MSWTAVLLVALAVSVDGFWGGLAFGLRRVRITIESLALISLITVACTMFTMVMGRTMHSVVPFGAAKWLSAVLLITMGLAALREGLEQRQELRGGKPPDGWVAGGDSRISEFRRRPLAYLVKVLQDPLLADLYATGSISRLEASVLGLAVALDASIAAFAIGLAGYSPWVVPWLIGLDHLVLVGLGNYVGTRKAFVLLVRRMAILPGTILIVLGLLRTI